MPPRKKPEPTYIWIRQEGETEQAYEAFQTYLRLGTGRTIARAAAKLGKTNQALEPWSSRFGWVARVKAYDEYVVMAEADGLAHQMAEARDENLDLVRKLRGHLSNRLDEFIDKNQDPTVRWTQALVGMAKLEMNAFAIRDDAKTSERVERIEALVERVVELGSGLEA